jgi:hypothetical protein
MEKLTNNKLSIRLKNVKNISNYSFTSCYLETHLSLDSHENHEHPEIISEWRIRLPVGPGDIYEPMPVYEAWGSRGGVMILYSGVWCMQQ